MDDGNSSTGPSLSRRGLIRGATGVVVAGALLEAAAGSLGAAAAPSSGQAGQLTLYDAQGNQLSTIEILSWSWGTTNSSPAGGATGGQGKQQLTITKEIDEATPFLLQQESGQPSASSALLTFTSADGESCSITLQQIQGVSNELSMAIKSQGVPEHSRHTCVFDGIIIVIKIGNVTITIKF